MLSRKSFVASAAALAVSTRLAAIAKAEPSSSPVAPVPDASILAPYNNAWLYSARLPSGETRPQGIWSDHLQFRDIEGRRALLRVQGMTYGTGASSSVLNAFDPQTMEPILSQTRGPDGKSIRRTFANGIVHSVNMASPCAAEVSADFPLSGVLYDFYGGMYGLLLATFPLHEGAIGSFQSIDEFENTNVPARYQVVRRERVSAGSRGHVSAWRVQSGREGQYSMTFWLTKAPPYIIKLEMVNDGDPRVLTFDMI
jgi:hypothetical protein